jgi:hypothetical protein
MSSSAPSTCAGSRPLLAVALLAAACTGSIPPGLSDPGAAGGSSPTTPGRGTPGVPGVAPIPEPPRAAGCKLDPGPSPLRLLTRTEYLNTVRDLFGGPRDVGGDLPEDGRPARGFANDANARSASDIMVAGYMKAAEKLAAAAVGDMGKLLACDPAASGGEAACLDELFDSFGTRAWRRPLTAAERQNLTRAFQEGKTGTASGTPSFASGVEAVVTVMLIAPQFLYRTEQGTPIAGSGFAQLGSYEVASRLSYLLWGSMPDSDLLSAARANKLQKPEEVLLQARRMVDDARFLATVTDFSNQFLGLDQMDTLDKDQMTLPAWKPELRDPLRIEGEKFLEYVLSKEGGGKLSTFLTAPVTFVNKPLAAYYGLSGPGGDAFEKVALDPERASGALTLGGFLAAHGTPDDGLTSLVFRGIFVREGLLCQHVPDPPPNALDENPPFTPETTSREWSFARMAKPVCGTCHQMIDHLGFAFESYDPIGKWRTTERGKPVDVSGKIDGSDVDGPFQGVVELGKKLAGSKMVGDCVATQWFRFAAGRSETDRDQCSVSTLQDALSRSGGDLRELFVAFSQTDAFLFRSQGDAP